MKRLFWSALAAALAAAAGTAIVWIIVGELGDVELRIVLSAVGVFLTLASGVAALRLWEQPALRPLAGLALVAVPLELGAFTAGSWYGNFGDGFDTCAKLYVTALAWTLASLLVTTCALLPLERVVRRVFPLLTFGCAVGAAAVATYVTWSASATESWARALYSLAIAAFATWLLGPTLQRAASVE